MEVLTTSEQLKATLRQRPFRPFTIRMVDGRSFTVPHPDWVMVSPTGRAAILFEPDDSDSVARRVSMPPPALTAAPPPRAAEHRQRLASGSSGQACLGYRRRSSFLTV